MNATELVSRFRSRFRDVSDPPLWSTEEIYEYADEAQKMFCRLTGGIPDSSSAITILAISEGDTTVPYSDRILKITRAYRVSDDQKVNIVNNNELAGCESSLTDAPGKTQSLVVGMDASTLRIIPEALEADTIKLSVSRLPLTDIDENNVEFEIQSIHHNALLLWMGYLAHMKMDAETFNQAKADNFYNGFHAYCVQASADIQRRDHKPRSVRYGGL